MKSINGYHLIWKSLQQHDITQFMTSMRCLKSLDKIKYYNFPVYEVRKIVFISRSTVSSWTSIYKRPEMLKFKQHFKDFRKAFDIMFLHYKLLTAVLLSTVLNAFARPARVQVIFRMLSVSILAV